MESSRECLLVEQIAPRVEHYIKQTAKQRLLKIYEDSSETIFLESVNCQLSLAEIYAQIEFKDEPKE